ncbi:MAG: DNA mismatch endonuclease Vsr [Mariprofundaceae bacterium]
MDVFEPDKRSDIMRRVKSENTKPEMRVRRLAHAMGYRFRLHCAYLPGKPDLVFPGLGKVIFVHGCFWHGHDCPAGRKRPKSNIEYWQNKLGRNRLRDEENIAKLEAMNWGVLIIWECMTRDAQGLHQRLAEFLGAYA